ncbi:MAG TPA: exosortase system-associated protein, TIGR04073 family [Desulfuromonadaceae bacterium]|jgi:putative exosortase-associated protein (TIGR04073 family)
MRKLARVSLGFLLLFFISSRISCAEDKTIYSGDVNLYDQDAQAVVGGMSHKLVRGVANVATGLGEFPKQIYLTSRAEGALMGSTVGPLKGIGMAIVRTFVGVHDVVFFFLPIPGFYNPIIDPVYVWEKEK